MTLINVAAGTDYTEDAVALDAFSATPLWNPPGSILAEPRQRQPEDRGRHDRHVDVHRRLVASGNPPIRSRAVLMHNNV